MNNRQDEGLPAVLDLSGFTRRLPVAAIHWQLEHLAEGETLSLIISRFIETELLQSLLMRCGAEVVAEERDNDQRRLLLRRQAQTAKIIELDMRGRRCPAPVIEARRSLRTMAAGEQLRMLSDCTGAPAEVTSWAAHATNVSLLGQWHQEEGHVFLLGRSRDSA